MAGTVSQRNRQGAGPLLWDWAGPGGPARDGWRFCRQLWRSAADGRTDGRVRGLGLRTPDKGLLFSGLHFHRLAKPQKQEEKVRRVLQIPRACKGEHGEPQPYRGWRLAPGPIQPCLGRRSPARGASITLPRSLSHLQADAGHFPRRLRLTRGSQDPGMSGWRETYGHLVHLRGNSCAGS